MKRNLPQAEQYEGCLGSCCLSFYLLLTFCWRTAISSNGVAITEQNVKAANNQWQHLENAPIIYIHPNWRKFVYDSKNVYVKCNLDTNELMFLQFYLKWNFSIFSISLTKLFFSSFTCKYLENALLYQKIHHSTESISFTQTRHNFPKSENGKLDSKGQC